MPYLFDITRVATAIAQGYTPAWPIGQLQCCTMPAFQIAAEPPRKLLLKLGDNAFKSCQPTDPYSKLLFSTGVGVFSNIEQIRSANIFIYAYA